MPTKPSSIKFASMFSKEQASSNRLFGACACSHSHASTFTIRCLVMRSCQQLDLFAFLPTFNASYSKAITVTWPWSTLSSPSTTCWFGRQSSKSLLTTEASSVLSYQCLEGGDGKYKMMKGGRLHGKAGAFNFHNLICFIMFDCGVFNAGACPE
jgi:hypothetical protein